MGRYCKKYEVIKMNELKGWPFQPMDERIAPCGDGGFPPDPCPG
jgi:hypothetical protein